MNTEDHLKNIKKLRLEAKELFLCSSSLAFCDSSIHDFDNCPLIKQTDNCKKCRHYH